jgi:hypothetical protein
MNVKKIINFKKSGIVPPNPKKRKYIYFLFKVLCSSYSVRHSSVGCSLVQKGAAKLRRA